MESCRELVTRDEVKHILNKCLHGNNFELRNYGTTRVSDSPLGFNGDHCQLFADITVDSQPDRKTFFVKTTPEVATFKAYVEKTRSFYKEIGMYETMFEDFKNKTTRKWRPECYYARGASIMVMEDVKAAGYSMLPERTLLPESHVKAALDSVAIMHGAALIFEERFNAGEVGTRSKEFHSTANSSSTVGDVYSHLLFETEATADVNHPGHLLYEKGFEGQLCLIDLLPGFTEEERKTIRENLQQRLRRIYELVKPSTKYKNVVVHCDLWLNNLMFRNNDAGRLEALILDFQIARFAPPAHDVMMFLHLVQDKAFRESRQEDMLAYYYSKLSEELQHHGLDCARILPWQEFRQSCDDYYELALITAIFYFQFIIAPGDICAQFLSSPDEYTKVMFSDRTNVIKTCFLQDEIYRTRVTETMQEFIRHFVL